MTQPIDEAATPESFDAALDTEIIDIVKALTMFAFHRGNWGNPIELHELIEYTSALKKLYLTHRNAELEKLLEQKQHLIFADGVRREAIPLSAVESLMKEGE